MIQAEQMVPPTQSYGDVASRVKKRVVYWGLEEVEGKMWLDMGSPPPSVVCACARACFSPQLE